MCSLCRLTTRQMWTPAPLIPLPTTTSQHMEGWKRRRRRSSLLTSTSIWSQTCWSPSAAKRDWPGRPLTCCRAWVYTYHPTLIPHKRHEVHSVYDFWQVQTQQGPALIVEEASLKENSRKPSQSAAGKQVRSHIH